jgi:hypothetical protein
MLAMLRQIIRRILPVFALSLTLASAPGRQQDAALDKIVVRNTAKKDGSTVTYNGRLRLSSVGLQVLSGEKLDKVTTIRFADLVRFEPGDMPGVNRDDMLAQLKLESNKTKKDYETARGVYAAMLKKAGGAPEATKRHLEFRVALMSTKIADESSDDEKWAELAAVAAKEWTGFLTGYNAGWEIWHAARTLARLYIEENKYDEVAKVWGRMARNPELPPDLKLDAGIEEVDALFRGKLFSAAASQADALGKSTGPGSAKDRLAIYERAARAADGGIKADGLPAVVDDIRKKIAATKDPAVRAVGFGVIGELDMLVNLPRDAMWEFLWVETVYNSDRDEVLKAMCRLVESFKAQMDEERPKQYREKIRRLRASF